MSAAGDERRARLGPEAVAHARAVAAAAPPFTAAQLDVLAVLMRPATRRRKTPATPAPPPAAAA